MRDSRKRKVKDAEGNTYVFHLRRLKCEKCGQVHTEIPDFIIQFKHYSKIAIEDYLNGKSDTIAADNKTLYRWRKGK